MVKVGVTGGIGSGKTTICRVFESLGIPVFYADVEAKKLYDHKEIKEVILNWFGESIFDNGNIDKKKLASIVFADNSKLEQLNKLIHPLVRQQFVQWADNKKHNPYIIEEAALLFESRAYNSLDYTIVVSAPHELRIKRVIQRDGVSREAVLQRMAHQMNETETLKRANFVIYNDDMQFVLSQVLDIHQKILGKG